MASAAAAIAATLVASVSSDSVVAVLALPGLVLPGLALVEPFLLLVAPGLLPLSLSMPGNSRAAAPLTTWGGAPCLASPD